MVQQVKDEITGQIHEFPDDATPEEMQEALNSMHPVNDSQFNISDYLPKVPPGLNIATGLLSLVGKNPWQKNVIANLPQVLTGEPSSISKKVEQGIGEYLPFTLSGGSGLLPQIVSGLGYGAATTAPDEKNPLSYLPSGKLGGAIESAGINALTHGAFNGIEALRPSRLFRGSLPAKELQANVESAGDTSTGLGDVIASPFLKRQYENIISKLPFSGATEKYQEAGQAVLNKGEKVLSDVLGVNDPENVTDTIHHALMKQFEQHRENKNALYDKFNEEANKQFLDLSLPKFSAKAKEYADAIESSNILKYEPDLRRILAKLNVYKEPVEKIPDDASQISQFGEKMIGEPLTTFKLPTAQEANILKGKLNDYAKINKTSPDSDKRYQAKIFGNLASTLKEDIKDAVENSGNPVLKSSYNEAEENYKKNFSPFLDKEIYKYLGGGKDPDTIVSNFVKITRGGDRSKAALKLTNVLPDKQRSLVGYAYLSRAIDNDGNLNPSKLSTLINNLGKNQFKALVPDSNIRNQLKNYNKLYKMNNKAVHLMQNPATGQQNLDILPALLAHAGTTITGGALGGLPGAMAGLIFPGLAAKPLVNILTSPSIRKSLVDAMIANKQWPKGIVPGIQTAIQGTLNVNR